MTFDEWYAELKELAEKNELGWLIPPKEDYPHDAFDDDLTPEEALNDEISYAIKE